MKWHIVGLLALMVLVQACAAAPQNGGIGAQSAGAPTPTLDLKRPTPTPEMLVPDEPRPTSDPAGLAPLETAPTRVEMTTGDGVTLVGDYYPPAKAGAPVLLLVHMVDSKRGVWRDFAMNAQVKGYAALAIDLRGYGESKGTRDYKTMDQDLEAALAWLMGQDQVATDRIGVVGASIGANLALRAAAAHPEVKAVALLSPGMDYRGVTVEEAIAGYGTRALFLASAKGDGYSADTVRELEKLAKGKVTLELYPGNAHGTDLLTAPGDLVDKLFTWLADTL